MIGGECGQRRKGFGLMAASRQSRTREPERAFQRSSAAGTCTSQSVGRVQVCACDMARERGETPETGVTVAGFVEDSVDRFSDLRMCKC